MGDHDTSVPEFTFVPSNDFKKEDITKTDIIPNGECFVLFNVFTEKECKELIDQGEKFGFLNLGGLYDPRYRNNERIINLNPTLNKIMWKRITDHIEDQITLGRQHDTLHLTPFTEGVWEKYGLNERFRLCKYNPTNFFKSHYDEGYHPQPTTIRTMKTCMLYLNDEFEGGETIFYIKSKSVALKPKTGMCLIFNQKILHEGATVKKGLKYFIRNDIYYKRITKREVELSEIERSAIDLYNAGVSLESTGNTKDALACYIKATKKCHNVAELYDHIMQHA
jgi:hypothetical protein